MRNQNQLRETYDRMIEWMDTRDDQGVNVSLDVKRLDGLFRAIQKKYERIGVSPRVARNEPNDLEGIRAQRLPGPRILLDSFDAKAYENKVRGAWLAREAGCTLGAVVEFNPVHFMQNIATHTKQPFPPKDYWTYTPYPWNERYLKSLCADYLRHSMTHVPADDDLTYTLLDLLILEDYGVGFTTEQVGKAWKKYLPTACTAEHIALENLKKGVSWKLAGEKGNPWVEWIGADIRSDGWGYAAPGLPQVAAELAYRDAYISHRQGGIYGEMFFAATIAAAFAVKDPLTACEIGLTEIPRKSRCYAGIRWALDTAPKVKDYLHARKLVEEKFVTTRQMNGVHTVLNAALTIFGLALGGKDMTKVIGNTVAMGYDNDCTAATAGSIVGAVIGGDKVPPHWYKPFNNKVRTYINGHEWFKNTDIVKRFTTVASKVWDCVEICDCKECR